MSRTLSVLLLAVALSSCGDDEPETPTAPTAPTTFTETFAGTLTRNGAQTHTFSSQASGTVTATLQTLSNSPATVGLALGTFNAGSCQVVITNDKAVQATVVGGGVSAIGSLCVRIFDAAGTLPGPTDYQIVVVHP